MPTQPRTRLVELVILALAIASCFALNWVDTRQNWDDTGITVGLLLLTTGLLAFLAPRRVWLIALAVGVWIPAQAVMKNGVTTGTLSMFLVLLFPLAAAYGALGIRQLTMPGTKTP